MIDIWLKLESNKFPFKVKFIGNDIYDLKNEVIVELAPKLNSFAAVDIGICSSTEKALFLDNFFVSDLLRTTQKVLGWLCCRKQTISHIGITTKVSY
jgi:hypothetical protein